MSQVLHFKTTPPQTEQGKAFLVFSNTGTLDMNLVKLLGVSVKESDNPIGFFGTGLKYAMATALRLGGAMTIFTDGQRYDIGGKEVTLRDKSFTQVTLNDEPLGFTTELGKQWQAWMVVRELYSNALDEKGETSVRHGDIAAGASEGKTIILLKGDCFLKVWDDRQHYFLAENEPLVHRSPYLDAHVLQMHNHAVFYRGIKIHDTQRPTLYRYNIRENVQLTEDRTLRYPFQFNEALEKSIITSGDEGYIARSLTTGEAFHEGLLRFDDTYANIEPSQAFKSICAKLNARRPQNLNMAAIRWYQARTQAVRAMVPDRLTKVQEVQLAKAVGFLRRITESDAIDLYPIHVVQWLGENIYGQAKDGTIYLTRQAFEGGTKKLAAILYEEFVHCHYDLRDETRELQSWLFERIVTMGEEFVLGEPL